MDININSRAGQAPPHLLVPIVVIVVLAVVLTVPLLTVQKISLSLDEGQIQNPSYVEESGTIVGNLLSKLQSKQVSNAKVEIVVYPENQRDCIGDYEEDCKSVVNRTIWTTPTSSVETRVNLQEGRYVASLTSFVYNEFQNQMVEEDDRILNFAVEQ